MGGGIQQAIAGKYAVLTGAANPMIFDTSAGGQIDEFDARSSQYQILIGCLVAIAAVMTHAGGEKFLIARALYFDLASSNVTGLGESGVPGFDGRTGPDEIVHNKQIDRGIVSLEAGR